MVMRRYTKTNNDALFLDRLREQVNPLDTLTSFSHGELDAATIDFTDVSGNAEVDIDVAMANLGYAALGDGDPNLVGIHTLGKFEYASEPSFTSEGDVGYNEDREELVVVDPLGVLKSTNENVPFQSYRDGTTQVGGGSPDEFKGHVATASFKKTFDPVAQLDDPTGNYFKPDGAKMYLVSSDNDEIYEYDLSVPWEVDSAVFLRLLDVSTDQLNSRGLFIRDDGLKFYISDIGNMRENVSEYNMTTAWDISTGVFVDQVVVVTNSQNPTGVFFRPDGRKMYVSSTTATNVSEYDLSIPWDVTTAVFLHDLSTGIAEDLVFKRNGTVLYLMIADSIEQYRLATPWDVSTGILEDTLDVSFQAITFMGIFINDAASRMYLCTDPAGDVFQYNLGIEIGSLQTDFVKTARLGFAVTTNTEALGNAEIYACTDTAAPRTLTLSTFTIELGSPTNPYKITVKDESGAAGTNNITIDTEDSELIDGAASIALAADFAGINLYSDGSNLFSIGTT